MKASLYQITARAQYLEWLLSGSKDLATTAINGDLGWLEASLHEIGHVVTLRGSLKNALRTKPIIDVDRHMLKAGLYGIMRDEYEVSTIAVELLTAELLGHPIDRGEVIRFAWDAKNVIYFSRIWQFNDRVCRRMQNPRCRELADELARCLSAPLRVKRRRQ